MKINCTHFSHVFIFKGATQGSIHPNLIEITLVISEKIFKEFLVVCKVKLGFAHYSHGLCDSNFHKPFLKRVTKRTFLPSLCEIHPVVSEKIILHRISAPSQKSDQWFQRRRISKKFPKFHKVQKKKSLLPPPPLPPPWFFFF